MMKTKTVKAETQYREEIKLKAIILLSQDGLPSGNKLGYINFEIYCILNYALEIFLEEELFELCAEIRDYLETDEMIEVRDNFVHYAEFWNKTKKIF